MPGFGQPSAPLFQVTDCAETSSGVPVTPRSARSATIASQYAGGTAAGVPGGETGPGELVRNGGRSDADGVGSVMGPPAHAVSESSRMTPAAARSRGMSLLDVALSLSRAASHWPREKTSPLR